MKKKIGLTLGAIMFAFAVLFGSGTASDSSAVASDNFNFGNIKTVQLYHLGDV